MSSKKKLIITISALCVVLLFAAVSVVSIFASLNLAVNPQFKVSYTAKNVAATINANYIRNENSYPLLTSAGEEVITVLPTDESVGTFETSNLEADAVTGRAVFEYIFKNDSSTAPFQVSLTTSDLVLTNMSVAFASSYTPIVDFDNLTTTSEFAPATVYSKNTESGAKSVLYAYVIISIDDLSKDGSFSGSQGFYLASLVS